MPDTRPRSPRSPRSPRLSRPASPRAVRGGSYGSVSQGSFGSSRAQAPRPPGKAAFVGRGGPSLLERGALVVLPCLIFCVLCAFFASVYHWAPAIVWLLLLACVVLGVMQWRQATRSRPDSMRAYLALECLAAAGAAALVGLLVYESYMALYWSCADSHVYTNILPSESADGYVDAGKLVFADDSIVNKNHSVGFKDRHVYCVAPIIDDPLMVPVGEQAVQFWAVGLDCCGPRGAFACDDAWDWKARSGLVVRGLEMHPQYLLAARQAEAAFGLPRPMGDQVFVRWLRDPEAMELDYWRAGAGLLFAAAVFHALASCVAAWFIVNKAVPGLGIR